MSKLRTKQQQQYWWGLKKKKKKSYPRNWAPAGPTSTSRLARPSPSTIGGGDASLCLFTSRQVILVGAVHFLGGMMMRMPLWRLPLMEPPLASTMKLTRNLIEVKMKKAKEEKKKKQRVIEDREKWPLNKAERAKMVKEGEDKEIIQRYGGKDIEESFNNTIQL